MLSSHISQILVDYTEDISEKQTRTVRRMGPLKNSGHTVRLKTVCWMTDNVDDSCSKHLEDNGSQGLEGPEDSSWRKWLEGRALVRGRRVMIDREHGQWKSMASQRAAGTWHVQCLLFLLSQDSTSFRTSRLGVAANQWTPSSLNKM